MRSISLALWLLLYTACTPQDNSELLSLTDLELQILDSIHGHEGEFAVALKGLDTANQALFINKGISFHAASTMKTPVMIEVFKQQQMGKLNLDDSLVLTNQFHSIVDSSWYELSTGDDSEHRLYQIMGQKLSIRELVELMITESSNLASNLLIDHVGASNITLTMKEMGAGGMKVLRGVEDIKAFNQGLSNTTDAYSLMVIFEKLARGEVVSKQASDQMIEVLKRQKFNEVIPALLPKEITVAHKTGSISQVHHDCGIVYLPDGRSYVLILLSKDLNDFKKGTKLLQNISKMIYDFMMQGEQRAESRELGAESMGNREQENRGAVEQLELGNRKSQMVGA